MENDTTNEKDVEVSRPLNPTNNPTNPSHPTTNFLSLFILRQGSTNEILTILMRIVKHILEPQPPTLSSLSSDDIYQYFECTFQILVEYGVHFSLPYDYRIKLIDIFTTIGTTIGIDVPDNLYEIFGTHSGSTYGTDAVVDGGTDTPPVVSSSSSSSSFPVPTKKGGYVTYVTNTHIVPLYTFPVWSSVLMSDIADRLWPAAFTIINAAYYLRRFTSGTSRSSTTFSESPMTRKDTTPPTTTGRSVSSSIFCDRNVLELGSGTGLAGAVITILIPEISRMQITDVEYHAYTKMQTFQQYLRTMYPHELLQTIPNTSLVSGNIDNTVSRLGVSLLDWCKLADDIDRHSCKPLEWIYEKNVDFSTASSDDRILMKGSIPPSSISELRTQYSVVIGSDLVYDPSVVPQLCQTLEGLLIPLVTSSTETVPRLNVSSLFTTATLSSNAISAAETTSSSSSSSSLSVSPVSLSALQDLLAWITQYRVRYGLLSTTYRNSSTYTLLQEQIQRYNLTYIEITKELSQLFSVASRNGSTVSLSSHHVLDTRPLTDESIYQDIVDTLPSISRTNFSLSPASFLPSTTNPSPVVDERTALILHNKYIDHAK